MKDPLLRVGKWRSVVDTQLAGCRLAHGSAVGLTTFLLAGLFAATPYPASAEDDPYAYQQFVKLDQHGVSVAFKNLPAAEAAQLVSETTGVAITLPRSSQSKTINLRIDGAKIDQAVRSFLKALELNNSFLFYDNDGRLKGVVAVEKASRPPSPETQIAEKEKRNIETRALTSAERISLIRDLGRWKQLTAEERDAVHERFKTIPPSKERDELIKEYLGRVLGFTEGQVTAKD